MQIQSSVTRAALPCALLFVAACSGTSAAPANGSEGSSDTGGSTGSVGAETEGSSTGEEPSPHAIGEQVPWPTDDWTVVAPEEMGMDAKVLEGAYDYAFAAAKKTQGVVIVRGGALVSERYADGKDETSYAASWSAGKSFVSTLVGMAVDDGLIDSVEQPMSTWVPSWKGTDKGAITLQHVLQMESGLDFVEDYANFTNSDVIAMGFRDDVLGYVVNELPVGSAPGSKWYYSSGDSMLLSGVVEAAVGKPAHEFAADRLFGPIGMKSAYWWRDGKDHALGFCCIDAPSREFAKFGLLFLRGGEWDGAQIVSRDWVTEATTHRAANFDGYAYQWWTVDIDENSPLPADTFSARGLDEQMIYVIPSLDLVVMRSSLYEAADSAPVAEGGYLRHFMPRGLADNGTQAPDSWNDAKFLAPIINSIEGVDTIDVDDLGDDGGGDWGDDPTPFCQEVATEYPGYCEAVHGCACDLCPAEFLNCDSDEGCRAIMECALEKGCRGIECAETCETEIADNGGVFGEPAMVALALSDCVGSCPTECE